MLVSFNVFTSFGAHPLLRGGMEAIFLFLSYFLIYVNRSRSILSRASFLVTLRKMAEIKTDARNVVWLDFFAFLHCI